MPDSPSDCPDLPSLEAYVDGDRDTVAMDEHIASCDACSRQIEEIRSNNALMSRLTESRGDAAPPVVPIGNETIPGYQVIEELHRGGQGVVYKARQLATKRTVAVKVLLSGAFATAQQRLRFEREVDLVAQLRHPNIVTVYDSGVTDLGRHWFAMEHIEGQTLDAAVRERSDKATRPADALRTLLILFSKVCAAVAYAHQRGVIHRDLKPGNILVDADGEPHVLDFGLAKPINPQIEQDQPTVTIAGGFLGTIAYASPEQTRESGQDVDIRSDVYSLGVVLYELLSGEYPYPVTGSLSDVLDNIARLPARPLRTQPSTPYAIDDELETITLKTLAKEPERRYPSAEALRRDLAYYLEGAPIDAKRDSSWYLLSKSIRRQKGPVAIAIAGLVLLVGFSIAMSILYQRASVEAEKVSKINIFLEDTLGSVEPRAGESEVTVRAMLDEGEHWIGLVLSEDPETEAAVRQIIGNGYRNIGRFEDAETQLEAALATRRGLFGDDHLEVARSLSALGALRLDQGRLDEAMNLHEEALRIRRDERGEDDLFVAMSLGNLARVHQSAGRLAEAEDLQRRVLTIRRQQLGDDHTDTAMTKFRLANLRAARGDLVEAGLLHEVALRARRELKEGHPDLPRSLVALARIHMDNGSFQDAEPLLVEACERLERTRGAEHEETRTAQGLLSECRRHL